MVEEGYFFADDQYQPTFALANSLYPLARAIECGIADNHPVTNGQELNECRALQAKEPLTFSSILSVNALTEFPDN